MLSLSLSELQSIMAENGQPRFRADQLWQWIWQKNILDFGQMTNLSKSFRSGLDELFTLNLPDVVVARESRDGTQKLLLQLQDGARVETVLIPDEKRLTQCISSQVGCPLGCTFCSTGIQGFERNMTPGEILSQILVARDYLREKGDQAEIKNIVFMGMGEPLLNWPNVHRALETLHSPEGLNFSPRRITVSTVGRLRELELLGRSGLASLAVSLHAPTQKLRAEIMPRAAHIPLDELMEALRRYPLKPRQRITIEYILLKGVNDSIDHARQLVQLLNGVKYKINLIACNPGTDVPYQPSDPERILDFERFLWSKGVTAVLRKSKGQDISAACGQLKADESHRIYD